MRKRPGFGCDSGLPMEDVVGLRVRRKGSTVSGSEIFEQLDFWTAAGRGERGDVQMCVVHVVEVRLLGAIVLAAANNLQTELVAVERQALGCIADDDRGVVD